MLADAGRWPGHRRDGQALLDATKDVRTEATRSVIVIARLGDQAMNLTLILGDGSREPGGRHDEVASVTLAKAFDSIADELLGPYWVTYTVPENLRPTDKFSVSSKRRVVVRGPSR